MEKCEPNKMHITCQPNLCENNRFTVKTVHISYPKPSILVPTLGQRFKSVCKETYQDLTIRPLDNVSEKLI